jgi:hypothetical protein
MGKERLGVPESEIEAALAAIEVDVDEETLGHMRVGAEILIDLGVGYDVAGIRIIGPNPECQGTVADLVGRPSHSNFGNQIIRVATEAKAAGKDPGEAVSNAMDIFTQRDEDGNVARIPPHILKKN